MELRITYHVDTRYMHAWYALETQCNGCIVTRGREGAQDEGHEGEGKASAAAAAVVMEAVAVEVGCNGLKRE